MSINTHLTSIKNYLRTELDNKLVRTVDLYAGQFTDSEIPQKSFVAPAVFISCLGWRIPKDKEYGKRHAEARIAIFVLAKHAKSRVDRMTLAIAIAEKIHVLLANRRIGERCEDFGKTSDFSAENLYSRALDERKHALFLISFWQVVPVSDEIAIEYWDGEPELELTENLDEEV